MRTNTIRNTFLAIGASAFLASCAAIPLDPNVHVGSKSVDSITASVLFSQVCVEHAPTFTTSIAVLEGISDFQRAGVGVYYHDSLDLSVTVGVKGTGLRCTMVFASNDSAIVLRLAMTAVGADAGVETKFVALSERNKYRAVAFGS